MSLFKIFLSVTLGVFFSAFLFFKKEAIACEVIHFTTFKEIAPQVYVDSSLTAEEQLSLINSINLAFSRVNQVYGEVTSEPRWIVTNDLDYRAFGLNPTGMQSSGFVRECIFLGPKGINVDVSAHELVHAEVKHRTTLFTEYTKLPAWFIEGTAIKVDYRAPFIIENIDVSPDEIAQVKSIFYMHDFSNTSVKAYQATRVAIEALDPKTLYAGLERLNQGEQFEQVFGSKLTKQVAHP